MKLVQRAIGWTGISCLLLGSWALADGVDKALQAKIDAKVKEVQAWASDPAIVKAVKAQNEKPSADVAAMTQEKWKELAITDPFIRTLIKNPAGDVLKSKKSEVICEAFVSSADGKKVAFLSKTTSWCHAGKPKHDDPMKNKVWQGSIEVDESSGVQSIQVAVPVLDDGKPIGSLVVGLAVSKLKD